MYKILGTRLTTDRQFFNPLLPSMLHPDPLLEANFPNKQLLLSAFICMQHSLSLPTPDPTPNQSTSLFSKLKLALIAT